MNRSPTYMFCLTNRLLPTQLGRLEPGKARQKGAHRISDNRVERKERDQESRRTRECGSCVKRATVHNIYTA